MAKQYQTRWWTRQRAAYFRNNPLCERCGTDEPPYTPAKIVHHIRPLTRKEQYDERAFRAKSQADNLMSVCIECHRELHNTVPLRSRQFGAMEQLAECLDS